eukprot:m51a1_g14390 hypothetical protein (648) ;mRNA; f:321400-323504
MSCNTTNTSTANTANDNHPAAAAVAVLETAWELRSHVVGRVGGGDLVWLALAFPAALAGPCVAQLRAAHHSACEPPEATDAAACDALVGAVARGRLGDARALLGGPLGPSLLRWRSAGRAAELVCYLLYALCRHAFFPSSPPSRDIAEQFVAVVASTRDREHVDPLAGGPVELYSGVAPVANELRLAVAHEADLHPYFRWRCSLCKYDVKPETDTAALSPGNSLLMRCGTCDYMLCSGPQPQLGELGEQDELDSQYEGKKLFCGTAPIVCSRRLRGLYGLVNSRDRPVFFGSNNAIGGIYCGSVLDDRAPRMYRGGFLCGLEAGNECSACHELHRRLLDESDIRCPKCSQRLYPVLEEELRLLDLNIWGWECGMCGESFFNKPMRPGVLMMRCKCGYDLCNRCCLGVIGAGYGESDRMSSCCGNTAYWEFLLGKDDWTTTLQQPLPARLFFLACAMGMAQSLRLMLQKPLYLDRASAVDGYDLKYFKDALLFAALRREGWIKHQQPKVIGRGGFVDVVRAMLQPPLTPAELSRPRMRTLLLWSLRLAEEDVHEIVSVLMAPPVSLTTEQCFVDRFFVKRVAGSEHDMGVLSRSQLGIGQGRWACWLREKGVGLQRGMNVVVDAEEHGRPDYDTDLDESGTLVRLFER